MMNPVKREYKKRGRKGPRKSNRNTDNPNRPGGPKHPWRVKGAGLLVNKTDKEKNR